MVWLLKMGRSVPRPYGFRASTRAIATDEYWRGDFVAGPTVQVNV
jgi:hypothetical protein